MRSLLWILKFNKKRFPAHTVLSVVCFAGWFPPHLHIFIYLPKQNWITVFYPFPVYVFITCLADCEDVLMLGCSCTSYGQQPCWNCNIVSQEQTNWQCHSTKLGLLLSLSVSPSVCHWIMSWDTLHQTFPTIWALRLSCALALCSSNPASALQKSHYPSWYPTVATSLTAAVMVNKHQAPSLLAVIAAGHQESKRQMTLKCLQLQRELSSYAARAGVDSAAAADLGLFVTFGRIAPFLPPSSLSQSFTLLFLGSAKPGSPMTAGRGYPATHRCVCGGGGRVPGEEKLAQSSGHVLCCWFCFFQGGILPVFSGAE